MIVILTSCATVLRPLQTPSRRAVLAGTFLQPHLAFAYDCTWTPDECARREAGSVFSDSGASAAAVATRAKIGAAAETLRTIAPMLAAGKLAQAESVVTSAKLADFTVLLSRLSSSDASAQAAADSAKKSFVGLAAALKQRNMPSAQGYYSSLIDELGKL